MNFRRYPIVYCFKLYSQTSKSSPLFFANANLPANKSSLQSLSIAAIPYGHPIKGYQSTGQRNCNFADIVQNKYSNAQRTTKPAARTIQAQRYLNSNYCHSSHHAMTILQQ